MLPNLLSFERIASERAGREATRIQVQLEQKLRQTLHDPRFASTQFNLDDIFDKKSGAVRVRDWEKALLDERGEFSKLFVAVPHKKESATDTAMYSDSALLLRGPFYYRYFFSAQSVNQAACEYLNGAINFLDKADMYLAASRDNYDFASFKVTIAILDNLRNICINFLVMLLQQVRRLGVDGKNLLADTDLGGCLLNAVRVMYSALLNPHQSMRVTVDDTSSAIRKTRLVLASKEVGVCAVASDNLLFNANSNSEYVEEFKKIFRWRECDYFLQSVAAIQIALHEFSVRSTFPRDGVLCLGIAFGGIELPIIARVIGEQFDVDLVPATMHISQYSEPSEQKSHEQDSLSVEALKSVGDGPFHLLKDMPLSGAEERALLMDDNSLTGRTLELARDALAGRGVSTVGAVLVRYPSANRYMQMEMAKHQSSLALGPLFGFIRGLIAPSPFTRLHKNASYKDELGHFDKAKERIERLLHKHGALSR